MSHVKTGCLFTAVLLMTIIAGGVETKRELYLNMPNSLGKVLATQHIGWHPSVEVYEVERRPGIAEEWEYSAFKSLVEIGSSEGNDGGMLTKEDLATMHKMQCACTFKKLFVNTIEPGFTDLMIGKIKPEKEKPRPINVHVILNQKKKKKKKIIPKVIKSLFDDRPTKKVVRAGKTVKKPITVPLTKPTTEKERKAMSKGKKSQGKSSKKKGKKGTNSKKGKKEAKMSKKEAGKKVKSKPLNKNKKKSSPIKKLAQVSEQEDDESDESDDPPKHQRKKKHPRYHRKRPSEISKEFLENPNRQPCYPQSARNQQSEAHLIYTSHSIPAQFQQPQFQYYQQPNGYYMAPQMQYQPQQTQPLPQTTYQAPRQYFQQPQPLYPQPQYQISQPLQQPVPQYQQPYYQSPPPQQPFYYPQQQLQPAY